MPFQKFSEKKLGSDKLIAIRQANSIIEAFQAQGYKMTLRQLYYQHVKDNLITNEEKSYKNLAALISDGRLCGLIDWDAIEDRGRVADKPYHSDSVEEHVETIKKVADGYTIDKWRGQDFYVELWVEKQALAGILEPLAHQNHVTLMVNKGYSSQSAMYESAQRFRAGMGTEGERAEYREDYHHCTAKEFVGTEWRGLESERDGLLLYLGDHDPSGEDMVRDIRERLQMFGCGERLEVQKVALTRAQITQYNPPPNPAKITDPRAEAYIQRHGNSSWEVDALDPPVLSALVTAAISRVRDAGILSTVVAEQKLERTRLKKALEKLKL